MQIPRQDTNADISTDAIYTASGGAAHRVIVLANRAPFRHEVGPDGRVGTVRSASGVVTALEPLLEERGGVWVAHGGDIHNRRFGSTRLRAAHRATASGGWRSTNRSIVGSTTGLRTKGCGRCVMPSPWSRSSGRRTTRVSAARTVVSSTRSCRRPAARRPSFWCRTITSRSRRACSASGCPPVASCPSGTFRGLTRRSSRAARGPSELLYGLLGSDTVGFQTPEDGTRFLESVEALTGARVNRLSSTVRLGGRSTSVRAHPVGVAWRHTVARGTPSVADCRTEVFRSLGLEADTRLVVGVDRLDYTKGINEKLLAVEQVLGGRAGVPGNAGAGAGGRALTRGAAGVPALRAQVTATAQRINERFGSGSYRPIVLLDRHHTQDEVYTLYRAADVCYVGSLRDGMNLVAKEFVCARTDERGVLLLSRFTGAAQQLHAAVSIDPFNPRRSAARPVASVADAGRGADAPYARAEGDRRGVRRGLVGRQMIREAMSSDTFSRMGYVEPQRATAAAGR